MGRIGHWMMMRLWRFPNDMEDSDLLNSVIGLWHFGTKDYSECRKAGRQTWWAV